MVAGEPVLRIARPTDQLQALARQYEEGLGFEKLGEFVDHSGFDGIILGHPRHPWHLEFTCHRGVQVGRAPTRDHLLVLYLPDKARWTQACDQVRSAGFQQVSAYNPYWDARGLTFEDLDGYRVVLQQDSWTL